MSPSEKGLWRCDLTVFVAVNGNLVRFWNKSCKEKGLANLVRAVKWGEPQWWLCLMVIPRGKDM